MNSLSDCVKNYLFVNDSADYLPQLYQLCLEKVKDGCLIVMVTAKVYDFSAIITDLCLNKDQLKNFIIMYYSSIEDVSRKLLLLHSWSLLPFMIVVDLPQLLHMETEICFTSAALMKKVSLCAISLLVYLESVALKISTTTNANSSNNTVIGLLILCSVADNFDETQIQIVRDLYFYNTVLLRNFDGIKSLTLEK